LERAVAGAAVAAEPAHQRENVPTEAWNFVAGGRGEALRGRGSDGLASGAGLGGPGRRGETDEEEAGGEQQAAKVDPTAASHA
jgi:hypothetical protein